MTVKKWNMCLLVFITLKTFECGPVETEGQQQLLCKLKGKPFFSQNSYGVSTYIIYFLVFRKLC